MLYREKTPWVRFVLIFVAVFILVFALMTLLTPINGLISAGAAAWLPDWIFMEEQSQYEAYGKHILVVTFVVQLILTGIILPWVEELCFRGYLLPRLSRFKLWAPLLGGLFFSLLPHLEFVRFFDGVFIGDGVGLRSMVDA